MALPNAIAQDEASQCNRSRPQVLRILVYTRNSVVTLTNKPRHVSLIHLDEAAVCTGREMLAARTGTPHGGAQ